jgi:hypothetical protein
VHRNTSAMQAGGQRQVLGDVGGRQVVTSGGQVGRARHRHGRSVADGAAPRAGTEHRHEGDRGRETLIEARHAVMGLDRHQTGRPLGICSQPGDEARPWRRVSVEEHDHIAARRLGPLPAGPALARPPRRGVGLDHPSAGGPGQRGGGIGGAVIDDDQLVGRVRCQRCQQIGQPLLFVASWHNHRHAAPGGAGRQPVHSCGQHHSSGQAGHHPPADHRASGGRSRRAGGPEGPSSPVRTHSTSTRVSSANPNRKSSTGMSHGKRIPLLWSRL